MEEQCLSFEHSSDDRIITRLLCLFFRANSMMLRRDTSEIRRNVSERCICANLKEMLSYLLNIEGNRELFSNYYADVEYNRGDERLIKAANINNEDKPIQCDLIVHSRGQNNSMDNLLCIEMKKMNGKVGYDRERLCELTRPLFSAKSKKKGLYSVHGYKLGIFYIYDYITETTKMEFYYRGEKVDELEMAFWELNSKAIVLDYIRKFVYKLFSKDNQTFPYLFIEKLPNPFIVFFNMGFGDSFLIDGDSSRLLVDCGSKNIDAPTWSARKKQIRNHLKDESDLLITHYHADHLNKIQSLSKDGVRFKNIYVRNLGINNLAFDIANVFVQLAIYASSTGDFNTLFFWLDPRLLFNVLASGGNVIGVNNTVNKYVNIGCLTANVLWPDPNDKTIEIKLAKIDCLSFLKKYETTYAYLNKLIEKYRSLLNGIEGGILSYEQFEQKSGDVEFQLDDSTKAKIKDEVMSFGTAKETSKIRDEMSDFENYLSIVFAINNRLLMTGDAKKRALNKALKEMGNVVFKIFKTPHHGTIGYFHKKHWNADSVLLIPNSKVYSTWDIEQRYCAPSSDCHCLNPLVVDTGCPLARSHSCPNRFIAAADFKKINL